LVFQSIGNLYRVYGTLYATAHVVKFSRRAYQAMLKRDGLWAACDRDGHY
jgi:hypothetical protein